MLGLHPGLRAKERNTISIGHTSRDWGSLARKLGSGVPLDRAATETGIPYEEAVEWAKKRAAEGDFLDLMMRAAAGEAVETAVRTLKNVANDEKAPRADRITCANELARLAVQILTKTQPGGEKTAPKGQADLFDKGATPATKDMGPWNLTLVQ